MAGDFPLVADPPPQSTTPEEDLESFSAMEEEIEEQEPPLLVSSCKKPSLEISLFDYTSGKPAGNSTYKVVINGEEREGTLREDGVAVVENASVDLENMDVQVTWYADREPGYDYLIELVKKVEEEEEEEEELVYDDDFEMPWRPLGLEAEPDEEDESE